MKVIRENLLEHGYTGEYNQDMEQWKNVWIGGVALFGGGLLRVYWADICRSTCPRGVPDLKGACGSVASGVSSMNWITSLSSFGGPS
jgi:hypothetical protein